MYNNRWKGNKETILTFSLRSGECCISLAKPLHWHIYWLTQIASVGIWIYMNVLNYVERKCYWYTFTKQRGRCYILFFWEMLKGSATDYSQWSPTLTTYPLSSQLRLTSPHSSLLCWVYSLQLQALLAPGLLSTKDRFLCKCVHTCCSVHSFLHPPHC